MTRDASIKCMKKGRETDMKNETNNGKRNRARLKNSNETASRCHS